MKAITIKATIDYDETQTDSSEVVNAIQDIVNMHGESMYSMGITEWDDAEVEE